nr:CPBP family intramembrane glutamic endopeptidase [Sphaerisporangium rubeum]
MVLFLIVAFGASWLIALPLWLGQGLATPLFPVVAAAMMFTPSLGVAAVWLRNRVPAKEWARRTGLGLGPRRGRTVALTAAVWIGTPVLIAVAVGISVALGLLRLDLSGLSLFGETLRQAGVTPPADLRVVAAAQLAAAMLAGPVLNAIPALGEEWGWRGWLLPTLVDRHGRRAALVSSGVIWGLWHSPLTLLGYNYPSLGPWAALYFTGFCVLAGLVLGWLRLRSESVWPAVVGHGALNAVAPALLLLGDADAVPNPVLAGITGLAGWVLLAVLAFLLFRLGRLEPRSRPGRGATGEAAYRADRGTEGDGRSGDRQAGADQQTRPELQSRRGEAGGQGAD